MFPEISRNERRIFDIGCGDVFVTEQLSKLLPKARFIAVDTGFTDPDLVQLRQKFHQTPIRVYKSLDKAFESNSEPVDIVLLLDVIEHIHDPVKFLKQLRKRLFQAQETILILTAPAFQWLFGGHDTYLKHYRRYNNQEMLEILSESGFSTIKMGYFFCSLLLIRTMNRFLENLIKANPNREKGIGGWKHMPAIDTVLTNMLYMDFRSSYLLRKIGIRLPGLSIFAICSRSNRNESIE